MKNGLLGNFGKKILCGKKLLLRIISVESCQVTPFFRKFCEMFYQERSSILISIALNIRFVKLPNHAHLMPLLKHMYKHEKSR